MVTTGALYSTLTEDPLRSAGCCVNGAFGFEPPGSIDAVAVAALQGDGRRAIYQEADCGVA